MFNLFKKKITLISLTLTCPDGLNEYQLYHLPTELDTLLSYISYISKQKDYSLTIISLGECVK